MERNKELKKISGDSVVVETNAKPQPAICKTIGGATYVARMHFRESGGDGINGKILRMMIEDLKQDDV